ncbi:MAG: type II toxin-antitoxin system VapC family toxin [Verrucomicrobiales bacterium]|jgi:predicted nucleic acid-binding protein|nr:type II toxin-antitoxin system VapC family toxin [Verrucomicrobiales bacterium]
MVSYADTGFIISLYLEESTRAVALEAIGKLQQILPITPLHELEFRNALNLRLWRKEITVAERDTVARKFEIDIADELYERVEVPAPELWHTAMRLSNRHTPSAGTRALDLLHVAAALTLQAGELLTFDERQRRMALAAGLAVRP